MKIDNSAPIPKPLPTAGQADQAAKARKASKAYAGSAPAPTAPAGTDRVEVSDTGRAMQVATEALKQAPQIRADKVAELKAKLKDGTYQVSGEDIAKPMLEEDVLG